MLTKLLLLGVAVAGLIIFAGCNAQTEPTPVQQAPTLMSGSGPNYYGVAPLEETIAWADVIARVQLLSVAAVAEQETGQTDYVAALDYRFRVLEYLRGSGGNELVAVAWDGLETFDSSGSAVTQAQVLKDRRDTQWDGREAILFLKNTHSALPSSSRADRYWLGGIYIDQPWEDYYTIASRWDKRWLPAASSGAGGASGRSDTQRFLLDAPTASDGASGASGQSGTAPTITLSDLKAKIATNDREIAAGGGSQAYKDCLHRKLEWAREAQYRLDSIVRLGGEGYFYQRYDADLGSGLAEGTIAFTDPFGSDLPATPPPHAGDFQLTSNDAALFRWEWPRFTNTVRPLPAGEYKFYYSPRPKESIICDGTPDLEKKRFEVFVTVTAPTGTLHEAFFDPVTIGTTIGADASNGVIDPDEFTVSGDDYEIESIIWNDDDDEVVLTLDDHVSLSGKMLDFIELDGSIDTSLNVSDATVDQTAATWTWSLASAPWENGDTLMLRICEQ
ncbi:MAG: hypothetical protein F4X20_00005 [Dehalococcoidia bacterium]|nr:hypothetical protein [Dehalococcoidia bacterium]